MIYNIYLPKTAKTNTKRTDNHPFSHQKWVFENIFKNISNPIKLLSNRFVYGS
jgi:hypothetical protein